MSTSLKQMKNAKFLLKNMLGKHIVRKQNREKNVTMHIIVRDSILYNIIQDLNETCMSVA